MNAPRRPGGDDRRPGRRDRRGAPPRPDTPKGKDAVDPVGKPKRVRPDGSAAGDGRRPGARAAKEGMKARGAASRPDSSRPDAPRAKPARVHADGSVAAKQGTKAGDAAPRSDTPRVTDDARPAGKPRRVRADGSVAGGSRGERQARARPADGAGRPAGDEGKPRARRVRADGSVAVRGSEPSAAREPQRIAKLLARAGVASRREIERMIAEGRVAMAGVALDTPATIVTSLAGVTVDGKPVEAPTAARLFLFHKPAGFLTAERDPRGRPTIYDRLPRDMPRVVPVGRLDMNTEGLLLLTTDGGLKRQLELPRTGVPRVYRARAYGEIGQDQLEALIEGVEIDGVRYGQIDANLERRTGRNVWIEMTLREGKNREVRRVLEYFGLQVSRLIRVAYGPFLLGELLAGEVGEVRQNDLVEFRRTLKDRPA